MGFRGINENNQVGGKEKKNKRKQDTCCYNYGPTALIRKLGNCICRRLKRCIKRKVFGAPKLEFITNKMKLNQRNKTPKKQAKKSRLLSHKKSLGNKLPLKTPSIKDLYLIHGFTASELKTKYNLTGSKAEVLDELVQEYKKRKLSTFVLPKSSKYQAKELDKDKLDKIIKQYAKMRKKSVVNIDQFKNMHKDELKRKFSLSGSQAKKFNNMIDDYKRGKISLTKLTQSKTEPKKLNKQQMDKMLKVYEEAKKSNKNDFSSRLDVIKPYYDNVKDNLKGLKDKITPSTLKQKYSNLSYKPAY